MIRLFLVSILTGLGLGIGFALPLLIGGYFLWRLSEEIEDRRRSKDDEG